MTRMSFRTVSARHPLAASLAVTLVIAAAAPALAQTRAAEIARQQEEKSQRLVPNVPSRGEVVLDWLEDYFVDPNTVYPTFGGIYPSAGFAPGIGYRHAIGLARFNINGAYSLRSYKLANARLAFPELAGGKLEVETHARWFDATQVPFYGVGNDTLRDERTAFGLRGLDAGATATLKPVRWLHLGAGLTAEQNESRAGGGSRHPSIETIHAAPPATSLFDDISFAHARASVAVDYRESPGYTRSGGLYSIAFNNFSDPDDTFTFRRVDVDLRQFVPVLKEQWVLAFRAHAQITDTDAGQTVPYFLLPSLGGSHSVRSYTDFRFRDRHSLLLSAEYRWFPSRVLDMALFVDAGKVAAERRDLDLDGLKTAFGLGARIHGPTMVPLRIDVARGREGFRIHLTGGVPF